MSIWDIYSDLDVDVSHKVLKRFRIHHRFSHVTAIGVTADVWSDTRHLQPLGKNATFATDMKPLCEGSDYARKSQFISNARAIVEANDITAGEHQLHAELKAMADRIAELICGVALRTGYTVDHLVTMF